MKIIALDLATRTGFARGDLSTGERPKFGHINLPSTGDDIGPFLVALETELKNMIVFEKPSAIIFEAPILRAGSTTPTTVMKLMGLACMVEVFCYKNKITARSTNLMTVKKYFTGNGHAKKHEMVAEAKARGFNVTVDDEADALGVYFNAMNHFYPSQAQKWDAKSKNRIL